MAGGKILVIDNERNATNNIGSSLIGNGFDVYFAENGKEGLAYLKEKVCDAALIEMHMDDMTALEFLTRAKKISSHLKIIIMTQTGNIENAVEMMHMGADYYFNKPLEINKLTRLLTLQKEEVHITPKEQSPSLEIIAESKAMKSLLEMAYQIAGAQANVFITGESGTGKEVIANAIHQHSLRAKHPYIRVNCAAIPETLIESEFFGHEKGAFTGASNLRLGRFELAHNGSLLLDEVTEIPLSLQAKLLRVVQELEFERVGGTKSIKVNVRLVSTSNRDIQRALEEKVLREDLFYRLNVIPIHIPPLRERRDDILPLANYFIKKLCKHNLKEERSLAKDAKDKLLNHAWPGNIRELGNVIERTIVLHKETVITAGLLNFDHSMQGCVTLEHLEKKQILEALQQNQNDKKLAAKLLGISLRKLNSRITDLQIDV
jgi:two-component system, NtrC family, response regulator AtoC